MIYHFLTMIFNLPVTALRHRFVKIFDVVDIKTFVYLITESNTETVYPFNSQHMDDTMATDVNFSKCSVLYLSTLNRSNVRFNS